MERVRLGFIGCGNMARHHGRILARSVPEAEVVALSDPSDDMLARFIAECLPGQSPATYNDYRAMLSEVPLDGVIIVSPHAYHFQQAMDAISAGANVLIEKPMVISTPDAQALIQHAQASNKLISVAFPGPFTCEFQYIRNVIASGELGEIYLMNAVCSQNCFPGIAGTWRVNKALAGGGNLYDSGAHMFNAMLYLTGLAAVDVCAFTDNKGEDVDVTASVNIRFTKGALGSVAVSSAATVFEQGLYISGSKGSIKTSIYGGRLEHWQGNELVKYPQVPPAIPMQQNFVDCILGRAETPSPAILGLRQARLMDAIYESAESGRIVNVVADA